MYKLALMFYYQLLYLFFLDGDNQYTGLDHKEYSFNIIHIVIAAII